MRKRNLLALAGLAAALVMALGVSSASANHLSMSHSELTRAIWSELKFSGGFAAAICPVTLESSFHSATITKTIGLLIGAVTGATVGTCRQGGATVLRETLPWHIQYGGFVGSLPRPTGIVQLLIGASFRISEGAFGINCLSRTEVNHPSRGIAEEISYETGGNGIIRTLVAEPGATIPCVGSTTIEGRFEGTARTTEHGGLANLLIRLI